MCIDVLWNVGVYMCLLDSIDPPFTDNICNCYSLRTQTFVTFNHVFFWRRVGHILLLGLMQYQYHWWRIGADYLQWSWYVDGAADVRWTNDLDDNQSMSAKAATRPGDYDDWWFMGCRTAAMMDIDGLYLEDMDGGWWLIDVDGWYSMGKTDRDAVLRCRLQSHVCQWIGR